ncbi:hypothetical protein QAD02_024442 [Eretmocerus hayati]|uniref:Uncharacterized protein n=1 Tax=Eretmocerus hayati TaxID=131215 RepID=A0ACC2Q260_9HYME|nr:hypothetical protein QAD02_024442 [Eretmocerus hayati]
MVKSCVNAYEGRDIYHSASVTRFIESKHRSHKPKKSITSTPDQIELLMGTAPEPEYLLPKVILAIAISGCLRLIEAVNLTLDILTRLENNFFFIAIPMEALKTCVDRSFTVVGPFAGEGKNDNLDTFINSPTGIATIGKVPKVIATFLDLPSIELYTSHRMRRTAATIFADTGANVSELMCFGVWKSPGCVRGHVDDSRYIKDKMVHQVTKQLYPRLICQRIFV